jgi:tRNA G10  N-methylase Trm11
MKYLFILGRNIELSKTEVLSYFEGSGNRISRFEIIENGLLIETEHPLNRGIVDIFGGVVSIGKVTASGKPDEVLKKLDSEEIYTGKSNKINYSVWNFSEEREIFQNYLKGRFREEKLKATLKHIENRMEMQDGERFQMVSSKRLDKEFFVFGKDTIYFGEIYETFDSKSLEERDMKKPARRESLAISPRLAKILINLSGIKPGETLLDPFCGIGTVLSEALLRGVKVIGIDKDKDAIASAKQNMKWFGFNEKNYKLINGDSTKEGNICADAVATEPDLGKILKEIPAADEAKKTLEDFENLMIKSINNLKSCLKGRIVFTSPYIKIGKKRIGPKIEEITSATGYNLTYSIPEFRESQIVGRMIYVLNKN